MAVAWRWWSRGGGREVAPAERARVLLSEASVAEAYGVGVDQPWPLNLRVVGKSTAGVRGTPAHLIRNLNDGKTT